MRILQPVACRMFESLDATCRFVQGGRAPATPAASAASRGAAVAAPAAEHRMLPLAQRIASLKAAKAASGAGPAPAQRSTGAHANAHQQLVPAGKANCKPSTTQATAHAVLDRPFKRQRTVQLEPSPGIKVQLEGKGQTQAQQAGQAAAPALQGNESDSDFEIIGDSSRSKA